jgi:nucleotide-binding universal stress UspA family protein
MYDEILLALDGSDCAASAADDALALAAEYDATLHARCVVEAFGLSTVEERKARKREATERLDAFAERAADAGVDCEVGQRSGFADKELLAAIDDVGADLVVMGTHGRTGVQEFLLGSIAAQLVRHSPVPVFTTPASEGWSPETVLVPTDGSEHAEAAATHAIEVAARFGAAAHVVSVVDSGEFGYEVQSTDIADMLTEEANDAVDRVVERAVDRDVPTTSEVVQGRPSRRILDVAEQRGADLVVLGTHGRSGVRRLLLGSVAEAVVRGATTPVLTVPGGERADR